LFIPLNLLKSLSDRSLYAGTPPFKLLALDFFALEFLKLILFSFEQLALLFVAANGTARAVEILSANRIL
jgi:hypothetical protein